MLHVKRRPPAYIVYYDDENGNAVPVGLLSQDHWDGVRLATRILYELEFERSLIELVRLSQRDIDRQENELARHSMNFTYVHVVGAKVIGAYLASMRTFLDQSPHYISKRWGAGSPQLERFERTASRAFDRSFVFRFMVKFRNYVQHRGLPFTSSAHICLQSETPGSAAVFKSQLYCDPKRLLSDYDGWGKVKHDLASRRTRIPIFSYARRMTKHLEALDQLAIRMLAPSARAAAEYLVSLAGPHWPARSLRFWDARTAAKRFSKDPASVPNRHVVGMFPRHIIRQVLEWPSRSSR